MLKKISVARLMQAKFLCENDADVNAKSHFDDLTALHRVVSTIDNCGVSCAPGILPPPVHFYHSLNKS